MGTIVVKPIEGALVRMPGTMSPLPAGGAEVSLDGADGRFWRRRLADGSVVPVQIAPPAEEQPVAAAETQESARPDRNRRNRE